MTKNEILNSDSDARRSAAGNPNTPGYKETTYDFVVTKNYVAVIGRRKTESEGMGGVSTLNR